MIERPVEPYSSNEMPERWAEIADYETKRADEAEKTLRKIRGLSFKGIAYAKCFKIACKMASQTLGVNDPIQSKESAT